MAKPMPLEHVRAVVLTQAWAGAYTTKLLGDMGAEVIQIEALDRPDPWRGGYPPRLSGTYPDNDPGERPYNRNAAYNSVNTSKQAITLDLNSPEAKDIFLELVSISDIVAENFSARVMPNFGLEYPDLRKINPSIIMLRMPTYGCFGPYSMYMGNGGTTEPMSGISSLLGYEDGPPMNSGIMHTDPFGGLMAFGSILIALHHRTRTGQGQWIDLSQQETSIGLIADKVMDYTMNGRVPQRRANASNIMAPHGNYPCKGDDSWVAIAVRSDDEWQKLCKIMDKSEIASDTRFADLPGRLKHGKELNEIISQWTQTRDANEVMKLLQEKSIPCSPVLKALEVLDNPQLKERGFFEEVEHPETGTFPYAGVPWKLSRTPGRLHKPAPRIGQHSRQVLQNILGMPASDVQALINRGITGDTPNLDD